MRQFYGGPEEGGWWRDARVAIESVRADNKEQLDELLARMRARYHIDPQTGGYTLSGHDDHPDYDRARERGRSSAAGGYDILVLREWDFAQSRDDGDSVWE